jgi:hypothetical protein
MELQTIYPYLKEDSIILLDDVPTKGTLAIDYLVNKGCWAVHTLVYQALIVHTGSLNTRYDEIVPLADICSEIPSFGDVSWDKIRAQMKGIRRMQEE